jgi:DNA replicative helicase MCM subunit Mcm2 (Cdc46/Mcm family)
VWIDYQELKIQEQFKHISAGKLPQTLTIIVEGGLEDNFRPGDDITVSGILDYRFKKPGSE